MSNGSLHAQARLPPALPRESPLWPALRALLCRLEHRLMVMLFALGVMSVAWMAVVAVLVLAQKLLPSRAAIDFPLALAIVGFGILIVLAPEAVPALTSM
jgi:hypothetical protein